MRDFCSFLMNSPNSDIQTAFRCLLEFAADPSYSTSLMLTFRIYLYHLSLLASLEREHAGNSKGSGVDCLLRLLFD